MNTRQKGLMKVLESSLNGPPLTVEKIARILGASERTVRYDLDAVADALRERGYILHKKAQKGVWIEPSKRKDPGSAPEGYKEYIPNKQERVHAIIVQLFQGTGAVTTEQLARNLRISRGTLLADLKNVTALLDKYELKLFTKKGLGLWIDGAEAMMRKLLIDIFSQCIYDFGRPVIQSDKFACEAVLFHQYTQGLPVEEIADYFIHLVRSRNLNCYDASINYMVVSLLVQLKRLQSEKELKGKSALMKIKHKALALLVDDLASFLLPYNSKVQSRGERQFLAKQLLSSKMYFPEEETEGNAEENAINLISLNTAKSFVEACQIWLGDIYLDDEELIYNLALHLQPAVKRAKYGIELTNPLLPQIQQRYGDLFTISYKAAKRIEKKLAIKLSDDEIGYLTIHLGAAIERKKLRTFQQMQVLLVCGNGLGTANLLAITLKNRLGCLNIRHIISAYELNPETLRDIDIVISTIPLEIADTAVLNISPILSDAEIKVIESQIQYLYHKKFLSANAGVRGERSGEITLRDVLTSETIALDVRAANWEEAVRAAGCLLVEQKLVQPRYVDNMIACIKKIGPYIVVGPGIAMPHARPEDGVNQICMSMVRLLNPVVFGSEPHDPIDLVFAFGTVDHQAHLGLLYELWHLFQNPEQLKRLRRCADSANVLRLLRMVGEDAAREMKI